MPRAAVRAVQSSPAEDDGWMTYHEHHNTSYGMTFDTEYGVTSGLYDWLWLSEILPSVSAAMQGGVVLQGVKIQ